MNKVIVFALLAAAACSIGTLFTSAWGVALALAFFDIGLALIAVLLKRAEEQPQAALPVPSVDRLPTMAEFDLRTEEAEKLRRSHTGQPAPGWMPGPG